MNEAHKSLPLLLTIPEVARLLNVSRGTVYNLIRQNKIKTVTPLGHQRIARTELTRMLRDLGVEEAA